MTAAVIPFPTRGNVVQLPVVRALADDVIAYVAACQATNERISPCGLTAHLSPRWDVMELADYLHIARDIAERETGVAIR